MISLEVAGAEIWDPAETAALLAQTLGDVDALILERKLRNGRYVEVALDMTPAQQDAVFSLGLPGVRFRKVGYFRSK